MSINFPLLLVIAVAVCGFLALLDVVFFAPEVLRLVENKQRRQREQLLDCREAAESGDGHA